MAEKLYQRLQEAGACYDALVWAINLCHDDLKQAALECRYPAWFGWMYTHLMWDRRLAMIQQLQVVLGAGRPRHAYFWNRLAYAMASTPVSRIQIGYAFDALTPKEFEKVRQHLLDVNAGLLETFNG